MSSSLLTGLKKQLGDEPLIRCKSMIITIMGDIVQMHGMRTDTASVITLNTLFGISKHSSRISIRRLAAENWLQRQHGSGYQFSDKGLEAFQHSAPLIYGNRVPAWKGDWQLLLLDTDIHTKIMRQFIRAIGWLGYGKMLPSVYLCPIEATNEVHSLIHRYGLEKQVWVFHRAMPHGEQELRKLAGRLWDIKAMQKEYTTFRRIFARAGALMPEVAQDAEAAMYLRLRLIHEYRRLILHTPPLPKNMRNDFFAADEVFAFCGEMYRQMLPASTRFIATLPLGKQAPDADATLLHRFREDRKNTTMATPSFPAIRMYTRNLIR